MSRPALPELARLAAFEGDLDAARYVLRWYADLRGWTDETFRARWDGASALLGWWHELDAPERPPLDDLTENDARNFMADLEAQALARTTVKGYRHGASALTKALRAVRTLPPSFDGDYDPFKGILLKPKVKASLQINERRIAALLPARVPGSSCSRPS